MAPDEEVVLTLHRARTVQGIVVDEAGTPVPGASVTLAREEVRVRADPCKGS